MELLPETRRCLANFVQVSSRLAEFHKCAEREIDAALRGCLILDPGLCAQATKCLETVRAATFRLANQRPLLLLAGSGAVATLMIRFLNGAGDFDEDTIAKSDTGFSRLRGVLHLEHDPSLDGRGRTVTLHRRRQQGDTTAADVRQFVDWAEAGRWLAERGSRNPLPGSGVESVSQSVDDDFFDGEWELKLNCADFASLRILVVPHLSRGSRKAVYQYMPDCALFLHHVDFNNELAASDTSALPDTAEMELRMAGEHCLLMRVERRDILMMHNRLHFVCRLANDSLACRQLAVGLVDSVLCDYIPEATARQSRALLISSGHSVMSLDLQDLLDRQMAECLQDKLRQLLSVLGDLSRAVRGAKGKHQTEEVSNSEQRRSSRKFLGDLGNLEALASKKARSFQSALDGLLNCLAEKVESHLRRQEVKDRLAAAFVSFRINYPSLSKQELKQFLLEQLELELNNWNHDTRIFLDFDRSIGKLKAALFQELLQEAKRIPELVTLSSDSFCEPPPAESAMEGESLSSQSVVSVGLRQIGGQLVKPSFMQGVAVGIGMPLFVPLAAITMAIIWPVTIFRRLRKVEAGGVQEINAKTRKKMHDEAWDFFDKIGKRFINENFFAEIKLYLQKDAEKLGRFVELYCIVPRDPEVMNQFQNDPQRRWRELEEFHKRVQGLQMEANAFGVKELGYGMLTPDQLAKFHIDCNVSSDLQLGEKIGGGSFSTVIGLPAQSPKSLRLALKLVNASAMSTALLEAEMMRELSLDPHQNLLIGLGTVYFPELHRVGLLMPRCQCNLRQLLQQNRQLLVPQAASQSQKNQALHACIQLYRQILEGVRHLHAKRILHRDLKLENVLADLSESTEGYPAEAKLRICDFGFAKAEQQMSGNSFVGTFGYLAPELAPPVMRFSIKSDIFALGVILWECVYGVTATNYATQQIATNLNCDAGVDMLIQIMIHSSAQERPHVEQCIAMLELRKRVTYAESLQILSKQKPAQTG